MVADETHIYKLNRFVAVRRSIKLNRKGKTLANFCKEMLKQFVYDCFVRSDSLFLKSFRKILPLADFGILSINSTPPLSFL